MYRSFRILKRRLSSAFTGEGARRYGGRWNSTGVPVVYTSSLVSLSILEWRANLTQWPPPMSVIIEVEFDASLVWSPPKLPPGWKRWPCQKSTALIGDNWVRSARSAVLKVPSAVVPEESNYLLNPAHPDFWKISIGKPRVFKLGTRLGPAA